ncbi:Laminin subunit alpha [Hypsibius exemplaris]|uniref:Laminin subunit alpha n=1 Tax=Hypsibius exemplaris TaxID=2072580 RepID=A0A1W0WHK0_HYPEX|nr:Laminin subunit alpha [Hypsibius exemplaris]
MEPRSFLISFFTAIFLIDHAICQVGLQPGQFNLATGRKVVATATCGEGIGHPEMYCKLTGANLERGDQQQRVGHEKYFIVQGQICDYCDATSSDQSHPAENAIDGTERWWQSPPLSRGGQFMEVNLTIDFNQEFHVAYILVTMGNSPRPEQWTLERSTDYGKTWTAWQHFADPPSDCETYFGVEPDQPLTKDDQVVCTSKYSRLVPLEGGEIVVSLVNDRPGRDNFLTNFVLQNWTKATNVRFNFQRMKTLMGHSTGVARQDQTVTRRYYYSVRDISIGGLCVCNGHASSCGVQNPNEPYKQTCKCEHNTCGAYCDRCCPGFVQKKWKPAMDNSSNACEPCNCHGHSGECEYDPDVDAKGLSLDTHGSYDGGGVCRNCQDNTEGINCDKCRSGYHRPYGKSKADRDACQVCRCDARFSTGNCAEGTGICECKPNFTGTNCDRCNDGYFDYPRCRPCECNFNGTINQVCNPAGAGNCACKANYAGPKCDQCADNFYDFPNCTACGCDGRGTVAGTICDKSADGQCVCNGGFGGRRCDQCGDGYFNHPTCKVCDCDPTGTEKAICDKSSGTCLCKVGHTGARCDQSAPGFYNYPQVLECDCHAAGSLNDVCDSNSGRCPCKNNFSGRACDMCAVGFYKFPECLPCNCDAYGTIGTTCNNHGQCQCKKNFVGKSCNQCAEGFYNYPLCEGCNCNPAGLIASFGGCGKVEGELCQCKERVTGRICDQCKAGYWGLDLYNPAGCDECACNTPGTVSALSICEGGSGACPCKTNVESRQCTRCKDGFFKLEDNNLHGCGSCGCDVGGAVSSICEKNTGQCACRPRVNGKNCSTVLKLHYFPTLHHLKFEAEDGRAKENGPVQYEFKEEDFPGYSWRGYAVMSPRQQEIQIPIQIRKPSLYRMIVRYINLANTTSRADIIVSPESNGEADQNSHVDFAPSRVGKYVSVGQGTNGNTFVLHPGQWLVTLKSAKPVLVDYVVLLPQAYYEATLLQQAVHAPCLHGQTQTCRNFTYPALDDFIKIEPSASNAFYQKNGDQLKPQIDDTTRSGVKGVLIDGSQPELTVTGEIFPTEPHHLILSYFTRPTNTVHNLKVAISNRTSEPSDHKAALFNCPYGLVCRSGVLDAQGKLGVFAPSDRYAKIVVSPVGVNGDQPDFVLTDITAIPVTEWHEDYVRPQSGCVLVKGVCQAADFPTVPDANILQAETDTQISQMRPDIAGLPPKVQTALLYLTNQTNYLRGTTQRPGDHVILVHYFQPSGPGSHLEAAVQGVESTPALLDTHFCPSASGCRAVIRHAEGASRFFRLGKDYSVTIKGSDGNEVYLDYVIAVPSDKFEERFLQEAPRNLASDFIQQCGQDYFEVATDGAGARRWAVNARAKPMSSARKCNRCKSGFWGFPNCKVCNCPFNSVCDPVSGACICPPRVTGDRCDTCMPQTYGFHPITGCQECKCNSYGTNGQLDCDQETGKCSCKPNVGGRICDKCITGYYSFPHCQACHYCDVRGALEGICDQQNGQCLCKENVAGPRCDVCKPATFLLDAKNPRGCTKCFCFGATNQCQPSVYYRMIIPQDFQTELAKWTTIPTIPIQIKSTGAEGTVGTLENPNQEILWVAPASFLGNRITSYGGKLSYSVIVNADGGTGSISPDVILKGRNMTVVYLHDTQPVTGKNHEVEVELTETNFEHESGNKVTRDQFMLVLVNLEALHIKAGYFPNPTAITLVYATLEGAVPPSETNEVVPGKDVAIKVEECACPPQYSGSSCENCSALHYRSSAGPYLGICLPCDCNGHAESCDPVTGQCINCIHNTTGERCDQCVEGFHGDATRGSPHDCMICACPIPIASNNFASSCYVADNGLDLSCQCREGYTGDRCQYCAAGYFGHPDEIGGSCQPCQCHGHIDPLDPESCDPLSGECLKCLNNTSGSTCNTCRTDFFGDPTIGSCQACDCDQYGTEDCNTRDGTCKCWPNVEGLRCDRCAPGHWEFESGKGCTPCMCGLGSKNQQCSNENGQCVCQPGVIGKRCDQCGHGFWNYTASGCTRCACATKYSVGERCDQLTGHCSCLPGVTGSECDRCKPRHVLVENVGCEACGYCVHTLLDDFDEMNVKMDAADREFERVSASSFAMIRLNRVNESISNLTHAVDFLMETGAPQTLLGFDSELGKIELAVDKKIKQVGDAKSTAEDRLNAADKARDELAGLHRTIGGSKRNALELSANISALDNYLRQGPGSKVTESQVIAEPILATLKNRKFDDYRANASFELATAKDNLGLVRTFQKMYNATQNKSDSVQAAVKDFQEKMHDLEKLALNASQTVHVAKVKTESVKENITDNVDAIDALSKLIKDLQGNTTRRADASRLYFTQAQTHFDNLDDQSATLKTARDGLETQNRGQQQGNRDAQGALTEARQHVATLDHEADRLDRLFKPTRSAAAEGKTAATAYGNIVAAVNDAISANTNSTKLADEVAVIAANNKGAVAEGLKASQDLNQQADQSKIDALKLRGTLESSRNKGQTVKDQHAQTEQAIASVREGLKQIPRESLKTEASALNARAKAAHDKAVASLARTEEIKSQLTGAPSALSDKPSAATSQVALQEILLAENAARAVPQELPQYTEKINRISADIARTDQAAADLGNKLEELKKKIELTRSLANRVKVGMQMFRNNTVQLKNPPEVASAATYTNINLYFKTPEKDGLLFYLGNEVGTARRTKRDFSPMTDDYLALEIENGFLVLLFDLGSGHARIEVKDHYVSDNLWHHATVERIGKHATVSVRCEQRGLTVAEGSTAGANTVFNLNQENSTFFIGGMPLNFRLQPPVKNRRFAGHIEGLEFDLEPIGLWNHGNMSFDTSSPSVAQLAPPRDQLLELPKEDGIKLDGSGYAIYNMEGRVDVSRETAVTIELKTFDKEGLLFLLSEDNSEDFLSLEIREGKVVLKYNLGSGTVTITSPERYDDGKWHSIFADRTGKRGVLQIDGDNVANGTSPGHEDRLEVSRTLQIGGHKTISHAGEVTEDGLEACIRVVEIANRRVKLDDSKEAKGTVQGCPATIRRMVSFGEGSDGYLAMPAVNVESSFQITLKFKTVTPNGLLFLTASEDNSQILSLSMQDGKLVLASDDGRTPVSVLSTDLSGYWNGDWHYISASKQNSKLRLMIDDFEIVQTMNERSSDSLQTTKPLYFGGIPDSVTSSRLALPVTRHFVGCIGDVVVNEVVQNFAISQEKAGASFASCPVAAIPGQVLPILPPQPTQSSQQPFWQPVTSLSGSVTLKPAKTTATAATVTLEATKATAATSATSATEATSATLLLAVQSLPTTQTTLSDTDENGVTPSGGVDRCSLPLHPETDAGHSNALQFGSRPESRQEFTSAPASYMDKSEFTLEFKTNATNGIILYVDDQKASPIDFIAIYIKAGQVVYSFNPGSGPAVVRSPGRYNDGQWHTLTAAKRHRNGQLLIDGVEVATADSPGTTEILNTKVPLYFGGVNGNRNIVKNTEGVSLPFNGCLRNLRLNGIAFSDPANTVAVGPCSEKVEAGAFFFAEGGHISLRDKFVVGQTLELAIDIRPRSNNGLILAVATSRKRRDFLALQLLDGVVHFSFDNGGGITEINVTLPSPFSICDGGWHSIKAVKNLFVASLNVDGEIAAKVGPRGQSAADTDLPIYLGSLPEGIDIKTVPKTQFVGCMRNLRIGDLAENFATGKVSGNVLSNSCHIA